MVHTLIGASRRLVAVDEQPEENEPQDHQPTQPNGIFGPPPLVERVVASTANT
jgi:hypothetical protein